jgi:hypothetical protein
MMYKTLLFTTVFILHTEQLCMGSEGSDDQTVSKEIEPDAIVPKTVSEGGQIYIDKDLAGCELAVAYEVEEWPDEDPDIESPAGGAASSGGNQHRYILQQCQALLTQLDAHTVQITEPSEDDPDAIAQLPISPENAGKSDEDVETLASKMKDLHPELMEITGGTSPIHVEAETSTVQKPVQILSNLANAINNDAVCLFACPRKLDRHEINPGKLIERTIYQSDGDFVDYDTISCVKETTTDETQKLYSKTSYLTTVREHPVVVDGSQRKYGVSWIKDDITLPGGRPRRDGRRTEVIAVNDSGEEVFRFEYPDNFPYPVPTEGSVPHREQNGEEWVVKRGYDYDAEVVDTYNDLDALQDEYADVTAPFIPDDEFDRRPTTDDFTILLFPTDDSDNTEPMIYEQGETRPLFGDSDKEENGG